MLVPGNDGHATRRVRVGVKMKLRSLSAAFAVSAVMVSFSACGKSIINRGGSAKFSQENLNISGSSSSGSGGAGDQTVTCYKDEYTEPLANCCDQCKSSKLDVLFVIDSAASLDPYRETIGAKIKDFIKALPNALDVRFGVLLGHAQDVWSGNLWPGCDNGPYVLRYQDFASRDALADELAFRLTFTQTEQASYWGHALYKSISRSIDPSHAAHAKSQGFYREDAGLAVVTISARNDVCYLASEFPGGVKPTGGDGYAAEETAKGTFCAGLDTLSLATSLEFFKGAQPVSGAALVRVDGTKIPAGSFEQVGYTFTHFATRMGGPTIDFGAPTTIAGKLGTLATVPMVGVPLQTTFTLRTTAAQLDQSSLRALVDGGAVAYSYDSATMEVSLAPTPASLHAGSVVDVNYCTKAATGIPPQQP